LKQRGPPQHDPGVGAQSAFFELCGQGPEAAPQRQAHFAIGSLLQIIGEGSDEQIATEAWRWIGAMQLAPGQPQIVCRLTRQSGNLAFNVSGCR
jgi:hypothetical protein